VIVNSDALLDRTLHIHVTREDDRIVINLYGGGIDQAGSTRSLAPSRARSNGSRRHRDGGRRMTRFLAVWAGQLGSLLGSGLTAFALGARGGTRA
jgi:hypothetical protein